MAGAHELVSYGSSKNDLLQRVLFGPVGYIVEFLIVLEISSLTWLCQYLKVAVYPADV